MANPAQFPEVSEQLLAALDQLYPDRCPKLSDGERLIWFNAGQRAVVNHLRFQKTQQEERGTIPLPPQP